MGVRLDDAPGGGAEISDVEPDTPADDAGLEDWDNVVEMDGEEIGSADDLIAEISARAPADEVTPETREVEVTLGQRPS